MQNQQTLPPFQTSRKLDRRFLMIGLPVGILGLVIVFMYLKLEDWRNAERLRDVQVITNAIHQYVAGHRGAYPPGLDMTERQIGSATSGCQLRTSQCAIAGKHDCVDLAPALEPYLGALPNDPGWAGNAWWTRYAVRMEKRGGFVVIPCEYSK